MMNNENTVAKPFLKWAGGKGKLFKHFKELIPRSYNRYFELFVGGGAVFFHLKPERSVINDLNGELMNLYSIVKNEPERLMKGLDELKGKVKDKEFYYEYRSENPEKDIEKAVRTVFLNKTGFNGMYRVNSKGEFNIPFGDMKTVTLYDEKNIIACSEALKNTEIYVGDYAKLLERTEEGDFVYLDPPYVPLSKTAHFTGYTKESFNEEDQKKLAEFCKKLDESGTKFLLNNSDTEITRDIFENFEMRIIKAPRNIAAKATSRKAVNELVITNY